MNQPLIIALSARALFDMEESNAIFEKEGVAAFTQHQLDRKSDPLPPGPAFHLARKLLAHNTPEQTRVEVVILSRNNPIAGIRVMRSLEHYQLAVSRAVFSQGGGRFRYLAPFKANLFLSTHPQDVARALEMGVAAATLLPQGKAENGEADDIRIAFDGDAVLFSDEAERVYKTQGLEAFQAHEREKSLSPLPEGPFRQVLQRLQQLRDSDSEGPTVRLALVTARGLATNERVIRTLDEWGVHLDEAAFLSGSEKGPFLNAFQADMFFDDQVTHIASASEVTVAGHVPHGIANAHAIAA